MTSPISQTPLPVLDAFKRRADDALVERITVGDEGAFEALFHAYYNALCIFAERYVGSAHVAEELVEDVFCWIWEHRTDWRLRDSVRAYLYSSVRNRALRQIARDRVAHRARRESGWDDWAPGMGEPAHGPEVRIEADEFVRAVQRAVASLPSRCRQTYELYREHEMSYAEIAAVMGTSVKTVENQLARAVKALRMSLAAWNPGSEKPARARTRPHSYRL